MSRLQIRLLGPYFSSFSAHSYGYEALKRAKIWSQASKFSLRSVKSDSLLGLVFKSRPEFEELILVDFLISGHRRKHFFHAFVLEIY